MTSYEENLVSIITPAYNVEPYIGETIATVQAQTYENWEWLVADDGSTDRTAEIVQAAADADGRIRLIRLPRNTGRPACARNEAMRQARGEFFAFLDADDLWEPQKLDIQVRYLREHPDVAAVCTWYDLFGDPWAVQNDLRVMSSEPVLTRAFVLTGGGALPATVLMRRDCYEQMGEMDEDPRLIGEEDFEYYSRIILSRPFHRICQTLTHYRKHPPKKSLTASVGPGKVKALNVIDVLGEKGLLTPREQGIMRGRAYYSQATDQLYFHRGPFRRLLLRSVGTGHPPVKAVLMLAMSFLPACLLRPVLAALQGLFTRRRGREAEHG